MSVFEGFRRSAMRAFGLRSTCIALLLSVALPSAARAQQGPIAAAVERCLDSGRPCARGEQVAPGARSSSPAAVSVERQGDDPKFKLLMGAFITAAGSDIGISMYQIGRGAARERGFGAWWQDSPVTFGITKSGAMAFAVYGLEKMHRTRPKTAFILGIAATSLEMTLAARGARLKPQTP